MTEETPISPLPTAIEVIATDQHLLIQLPPQGARDFQEAGLEVWQELRSRLADLTLPPGVEVSLITGDQLLDEGHFQAIAEILTEKDLALRWVNCQRRPTAIAAASAGYSIDQDSRPESLLPPPPAAPGEENQPLYLEQTVRSGAEIRHTGSLILLGDVNPGGTVIATGNILIWGRLRGTAHAGAEGDRRCRIFALQMEATQLRIADQVARAPQANGPLFPEIAYLAPDGIRIGTAVSFPKAYDFEESLGSWQEIETATIA